MGPSTRDADFCAERGAEDHRSFPAELVDTVCVVTSGRNLGRAGRRTGAAAGPDTHGPAYVRLHAAHRRVCVPPRSEGVRMVRYGVPKWHETTGGAAVTK